ncbi:MAG TPA: PH domain-containing protein [Candidatus Andersenbacteria bacterium]|nr:PH domain-containing protein [Candidatus Andersenbacteria bacterium]
MAKGRYVRYWRRFLLPDEQLIHAFGVGGAYVFVFWIAPMLATLLLGGVVGIANILLGSMFLIATAGFLLPILYLLFFIHYAVTNKRVVVREGVLQKRYITVDMKSITDISVRESFLERLLTHTGTIGINTAGSPGIELRLKHVRHPFQFREDVYRHLEAAQRLA